MERAGAGMSMWVGIDEWQGGRSSLRTRGSGPQLGYFLCDQSHHLPKLVSHLKDGNKERSFSPGLL